MLASLRATNLSACTHEAAHAPLSCASLWDAPDTDGPLDVISVLNFKETPPSALANWADYHLLHGVQHMVFVDNNCKPKQVRLADHVLKTYVERGLATVVKKFRCSEWDDPGLKAGGAPTMRYRALKELTELHARMHPDTLVLSLDDDEYLVMPDSTDSAQTIATQMQQHGLCAATLSWRTFGDDGLVCQPQTTSIVSSFVARAPHWGEVSTASHKNFVSQAVDEGDVVGGVGWRKGKAIFTWGQMEDCTEEVLSHRPSNGTVPIQAHFCQRQCTGNTQRNCADSEGAALPAAYDLFRSDARKTMGSRWLWRRSGLPEPQPECRAFTGASGDPKAAGLAKGGAWINHYAFQSSQRWEAKKLRGRTNRHSPRTGQPPAFYSATEDFEGALSVLRRLKAVRNASLQACLNEVFALPEDSPVAEEARLQGLTSSQHGPDLDPFVAPKALGGKEGLLLVHFSGAGGSSVVQWAQSKLGRVRHARSSDNANWGPQSRNDGWVSLVKAAPNVGTLERQTCERIDADIANHKGSLYGHETPVLAPLACKRAAVWVLMREPIERLLSRLYKPIPANASLLRVDMLGGPDALLTCLNGTTECAPECDNQRAGCNRGSSRAEFSGAPSLSNAYTRALAGPLAYMLPLAAVNMTHLAAAKRALNGVDLALPTWGFESLPFVLGLPAHVVGLGHEVHGTESSAEAAAVPTELTEALREHNKLDAELFRHVEALFWQRVKRQAAKAQSDLTAALALTQAAAPSAENDRTGPKDASHSPGPSPDPIAAPLPGTALDLCPAADFAESLVALSPLLPGAVARAGGAKRLTERYVQKFGEGVCPQPSGAVGWPQSNRSTPLLINMAEGSTGTRFLECILSERMRSAHFPDTALNQIHNQTNGTELNATALSGTEASADDQPMHECTRGEGARSCTGAFDAYDYVSDTPTAQLVSLLLDTHGKRGQAAALLSLRDPWEWVSSRNNHHGQHEKNSTEPSDDWMRVSVPCGCPWRAYPFKEPRGSMLNAYPVHERCNEPTSLRHYSVAVRRATFAPHPTCVAICPPPPLLRVATAHGAVPS